jgi:glycerophosphoryl diester phosphodiesterase
MLSLESLVLISGVVVATLGIAVSAGGHGRPTTIGEFYADGARPGVIAHRGFSARYPENTLGSISAAIELGADMVEIDVTVTADGHVVVIHDETLDRTTDGQGLVSDHTLEEIRRLDAGSWFDQQFDGETIPTLDEVLLLTSGKTLLNIEIKPEAVDFEVAAKVVALVRAQSMIDQVVVSSFAPMALRQVFDIAPEITTASLFNKDLHRNRDPIDIVGEVGASALHIGDRHLTPKVLQSCREHEIPVAVYTVNSTERMRDLIEVGVHAVFSDHPDQMLKFLAR